MRWLSGQDEGKMTPDVPTEWIVDFDPSVPISAETSYAVEWRRQPKPRTGWPVLDAVVLDVSSEYLIIFSVYWTGNYLLL